MSKTSHPPRPVVLCIMDGWGHRTDRNDNAVALANTPNVDALAARWPGGLMNASGEFVGLPDGQMGNSEVGHMNLGAGRVVMQDLPRINAAIADGSLAKQPAVAQVIDALKKSGGTCHLMGLVSTGGVHSHQRHVAALAKALAAGGAKVVVHVFTDGRDCAPKSAADQLRAFIEDLDGAATIASVSGRFFAMDRDKRWERVEQAWKAVCLAEAEHGADDAVAAVDAAYARGETDEFVTPTVIAGGVPVQDGDALVMANFRADRAREILAPFVDADFDGFARPRTPKLCIVAGMVEYSSALAPKMVTIFPPEDLTDPIGEVVAKAGKTQLRIAETEKYPHVTFFLNGGREEVFDGEDRIMVPSPKVKTYDLQPEMSAPELCDKLVAAIDGGTYDLIVANFANPDMVGHTGSLEAAIKAVETVDTCVGRVAEAVLKAGGVMFLTADHGNCEVMVDPQTGGPHTAHTTNLVPTTLVGAPEDVTSLKTGKLADVAPTLLSLMGIEPPAAMTGDCMLVRDRQAAE
ncbi:2,3-bisphosphoglycerate-independent phosphoglycerate mutase [Thalassobaculum sp. OXR-137]|uniref:2,3-bisphosphoglycerate-independent phosphoglycerate mutase n=1 Tax=Thalassobaculum sp. OXR-137 TaxID=3100173 RepID=UPI002AC94455|nr:2,3-bisphosphoglycerate-independent phosphoglycerate mutase [Thalassobaculum sp. OXR-137]WPZ35037.1 2,3-bisphosphoglycerate-independent phosphoglycerate mutase [Thalassobaculum sp. OXR-137]